jgi:hypothetical protein
MSGVTLAVPEFAPEGLALSGVAIVAEQLARYWSQVPAVSRTNRSEEAGQPHHSSREEPAA